MAENGPLAIVYSIMLLLGRTGAVIQTTMANEFMICTSVSGVFGTVAGQGNGTGTTPVLQGPAGSRGPAGKTGLPGPRGEPNYDKVSTMVDNKMNSIQGRILINIVSTTENPKYNDYKCSTF